MRDKLIYVNDTNEPDNTGVVLDNQPIDVLIQNLLKDYLAHNQTRFVIFLQRKLKNKWYEIDIHYEEGMFTTATELRIRAVDKNLYHVEVIASDDYNSWNLADYQITDTRNVFKELKYWINDTLPTYARHKHVTDYEGWGVDKQ